LFHGLAFLYCNPEATAAKYGIRDLKAAPEGGVGGMTKIRKYRHTRFRAVYVDSELLAVVVYRKGARAVADMLLKMHQRKEATDAA
jgi:hypothetical protein